MAALPQAPLVGSSRPDAKPAWVFDARAVADPDQIKAMVSASGALEKERIDGTHCLVTGAAGCLGAALSQRLLQQGDRVIGLDNLNDYYDPSLKQARLRQIEAVAPVDAWRFERLALEDGDALMKLFAEENRLWSSTPAQAGVRYPGQPGGIYPKQFGWFWPFTGRLSTPRHRKPRAPRAGMANRNLPFHEQQPVNHPEPLRRQQKGQRADGSHYSHLYGLPATGLRFFTVYGPWGREYGPDAFCPRDLAGRQSRCSTTARCSEISPISTTH